MSQTPREKRINLGHPIQGTSENGLFPSFPIATTDRKLLEPGPTVLLLNRHPFTSGRGWAELQSMDLYQPFLEPIIPPKLHVPQIRLFQSRTGESGEQT